MSNWKDQQVLIVGGGIGGLAAALALARKDIPSQVIEQASEFKEIGAGIQLGPNVFPAKSASRTHTAHLSNRRRSL